MTDKPLDEAQGVTVFNDPPVILVLRRKAIRMFPHGQSVAQYRNDSLNIDIAIPYTPGDLGKKVTRVATSEGINEAMSAELKKIRKERGLFKRDLSRQEDRFETSKQRLDWAKRALAGHIKKHGTSLDAIGEAIEYVTHDNIDEETSDAMFGNYLHNQDKHIETTVSNKFGHKALHHFLRAAAHYAEGDHETANHHYQAFKRSVTESLNEISLHTPEQIKDYEKHPENYKKDQNAKLLKYFREKGRPLTVKEDDDTIMEATIHSLHTITKTMQPAKIRFRDGSSAMIDHPVAAQIMKLHSKVNRLNKKKIEGLINGGPLGIRKVSTFIKDHMK